VSAIVPLKLADSFCAQADSHKSNVQRTKIAKERIPISSDEEKIDPDFTISTGISVPAPRPPVDCTSGLTVFWRRFLYLFWILPGFPTY